MTFDVTLWMPEEMDEEEKLQWAASSTDPHKAAGMAWESWAAQVVEDDLIGVTSMSTGAQSIGYSEPNSPYTRAMAKAKWHYARMASAVSSPDYPPKPDGQKRTVHSLGWRPPTWPRSFR